MFCDVLHYTDDPVGLLREAARVARHEIVIKDHTVRGFLTRPTLRFMDVIGNAPHGVVLPYNYFTERQWDDAYRECGLTVTELRRDLDLYPKWADVLFGRSLHFVARLRVAAQGASVAADSPTSHQPARNQVGDRSNDFGIERIGSCADRPAPGAMFPWHAGCRAPGMPSEEKYEKLCRVGLLVAMLLHWVVAGLLVWPYLPSSLDSSYRGGQQLASCSRTKVMSAVQTQGGIRARRHS